MAVREQFDAHTVTAITGYNPHLVVLAGYATLVTEPLLDKYVVINVHLADLSQRDPEGKPLFPGLHPVMDALSSGMTHVAASTHIATESMDEGLVLMISRPVPAGQDMAETEMRVKEEAALLLRTTLGHLAAGRFACQDGKLYHDGILLSYGVRL
jgi:phosphoribosylglycinamide formyltransferase-1